MMPYLHVMKFFLALILCSCSDSSDNTNQSIMIENECPDGQQLTWAMNGSVTCQTIATWPPASQGSRSVNGACILLNGAYAIEWGTDKPTNIRPAFSITRKMIITDTTLKLGDYTYLLQWEDSATALVAGDRVVEFSLTCNSQDQTVYGEYTIDLPYYHPEQQIETWALTGYLTELTNAQQSYYKSE
jgi:hypothetical protein